ncbi:RTA-like protein [Penicillium expansum]|nr:RTA-like protein [Penicillium expansum]
MTLNNSDTEANLYLYNPSHILPAVFAALVGTSLFLHIYQNYRYQFWRVTFFICWGGALFTAGWILRFFIYVGPPVYSAAAYNLVGRLMNYLPMHAVLNPNRVLIFFVYVGAAVEAITVAGAAKNASAGSNLDEYKAGGTLIAAGLVLQAVVECVVIGIVATVHVRCSRARMLSPNIRMICITLYGTSTLVLLRCIFRAVEAFEMFGNLGCREKCGPILSNEWYLYAFELGPMLLFTWWLNLMHPGRYLPAKSYAICVLMVARSAWALAGLIAAPIGRLLPIR